MTGAGQAQSHDPTTTPGQALIPDPSSPDASGSGRVPVGRFAPSPTGPLHFGSLVAAVASCLSARSRGGRWLVRIEDVDAPRTVAGAADDILRTLEAYALPWDGDVVYQTQRTEAYREALDRLQRQRICYACTCTRKQIAAIARRTSSGQVYPGTCRDKTPPRRGAFAIRVRTGDTSIGFGDLVQGPFRQNLRDQVGDFVVRRSDGLFAYQLAVVVDDADVGITEVVRGMDLFDSSPRQIHLQRLLGLSTPDYAHLPLAVNHLGLKLSKMSGAAGVDRIQPGAVLHTALRFLGQQPPPDLGMEPAESVLGWGMRHWRIACVPGVAAIREPAVGDTA